MRRDAADTRRVLPDREGRVAVADYGRGRFDEERQHVSENFRRDRHHAVLREQRPEQVGIAESVDDSQLREHAGRQPEIHGDRGHVPATDAATSGNDQLEVRQRGGDGIDQRIGSTLAAVDDRAPADFEHAAKRQHGHDGRFGRGHHPLVQQTFAHQHRLDMMTSVDGNFSRRGRRRER